MTVRLLLGGGGRTFDPSKVEVTGSCEAARQRILNPRLAVEAG
jgi:hypothetical protein